MSCPKYSTYKESSEHWIGDVPEHWNITSLKRNFSIIGGSTPLSADANWDGNICWVTPADLSELPDMYVRTSKRTITENGLLSCSTTLLPKGSLILSTRAPIGSLGIAAKEMCTNQGCKGLIPKKAISSHFYAYVLQVVRAELNNRGTGTTFLEISGDQLGRFNVPTPNLNEQIQIAQFLDHETTKIDALIKEQQRLIELSKEKRQAVISHAVTKGLDPNAPMKDSGVEWLGMVPANWITTKLGHYARILTGFPFPSASFSHDDTDVRLLRGANVGVGSLKWDDTVHWNIDEDRSVLDYLMPEGQIVLGMDRPWIREGLRLARVSTADMPCLLLQRVAAITPKEELANQYLFYVLNSGLLQAHVEPDLTGVSVPHISPEQILSVLIPLPPRHEQGHIVERIKAELSVMDGLFDEARKGIELLQERRSALISAAVTGKIDVRDWQHSSSPTSTLQENAMEAT